MLANFSPLSSGPRGGPKKHHGDTPATARLSPRLELPPERARGTNKFCLTPLLEVSTIRAATARPRPLKTPKCPMLTNKRPWWVGTLIASLLLGAPSSGLGKDIFVNNQSGDDRRDGLGAEINGTVGGPKRTISRALRSAAKGDRIVLAATGIPYREMLTLQAGINSGTPDRPFEIQGNGAVLDGTIEIPIDAWRPVRGDIYRFRPSSSRFQMLFRDSQPLERLPATSDSGLPELKPWQWCVFERDVYLCLEPGKRISEYALAQSGFQVGITLYEVRHVVIEGLIVQGFRLDGIQCHDSVFDTALVNVTCRGNGRSGISVGGSCRVTVAGCLVGNNGEGQVRSEGNCHLEIVNSTLLENPAPALVREGGRVEVTNSN